VTAATWSFPQVLAVAIPTAIALCLVGYQLALPGSLLGAHGYGNGIGYDDGVYFGAAIRLVHGVLPYRDFDFVQPPGITWVMTPVALLGRLIGDRDALALARCITALVTGLNVALAAFVVRKHGAVAMFVTGLLLASFPLAVAADHTLLLEPYLVCFCLLGTIALFRNGELPNPNRILIAGIAFGFAGSIKLWAILPMLAALILCLPHWKTAVRPFLVGCILGFGLPALLFLVVAPGQFIHDVFVSQIGRGTSGIGGLSVAQRLTEITGLTSRQGLAMDTGLAVGIMVGILILAVVSLGVRYRDRSRLDWFALSSAAIVTVGLFLSPEFYDHYAYFPAAFIAVLLGVCAGVLTSKVRKPAAHRPARILAARRTALALIPAIAIAALAILLLPQDFTYAHTYLAQASDMGPGVAASIPEGSCITTDDPTIGINANLFVPSASGCPAIVDPFGMWIARDNGSPPPAAQPFPNTFVADWQSWLKESNYVVLSVQFSDYLPWTPQLITWFNEHFTLLSSQPHAFVYRNETFSPPVPSSGTANELVSSGLAAEHAGDLNQALSYYKATAVRDPKNKYAPYDIGHIYQERGQNEAAASEYRLALRIDPQFADALYNMGVLETTSNPAAAILFFTHDLQVTPTNASANFNLGVLLIEHGQATKGYTYLETGLRLNPALAADVPPGITVPPSTTTTS
jgi:hypothetical protein